MTNKITDLENQSQQQHTSRNILSLDQLLKQLRTLSEDSLDQLRTNTIREVESYRE